MKRVGASSAPKSPTRQTASSNRTSREAKRASMQRAIVALYLSIVFGFGIATILFFSGRLVIAGVPSSVILLFLNDDLARDAYFRGENKILHDRLSEMGVEQRMKEFYSSRISDEAKLDQHIHQILYDRTGYVGAAYRLGSKGRLVPKHHQEGQ